MDKKELTSPELYKRMKRIYEVSTNYVEKSPAMLAQYEAMLAQKEFILLGYGEDELKNNPRLTEDIERTRSMLAGLTDEVEKAKDLARKSGEILKEVALSKITRRDKLYTPEAAAKVLGVNVQTMRRYIREGRINAVKTGKYWKIKHSEVLRVKEKGL